EGEQGEAAEGQAEDDTEDGEAGAGDALAVAGNVDQRHGPEDHGEERGWGEGADEGDDNAGQGIGAGARGGPAPRRHLDRLLALGAGDLLPGQGVLDFE